MDAVFGFIWVYCNAAHCFFQSDAALFKVFHIFSRSWNGRINQQCTFVMRGH